jgi:hypothetical protein
MVARRGRFMTLSAFAARVIPMRAFAAATALLLACIAPHVFASEAPEGFGVLVMAHGGTPDWNKGVLAAVEPLKERYPIELAFGMADAMTMQEAVQRLEAQGVRNIAVVRLFVSGESWYERTRQILGLAPGAPERKPRTTDHSHAGHPPHEHPMAFWRVDTKASFVVSAQGLGEAPATGAILAERARRLSRVPEREDVLIVAHGPGDDAENEKWIGLGRGRDRARHPVSRARLRALCARARRARLRGRPHGTAAASWRHEMDRGADPRA